MTIQGFGFVGSATAKYLFQMGAKIISLSDIYEMVFNEESADVEKFIRVAKETASVKKYRPAEEPKREKIFEVEMDIFVPAATTDAVNMDTTQTDNLHEKKFERMGIPIRMPSYLETIR